MLPGFIQEAVNAIHATKQHKIVAEKNEQIVNTLLKDTRPIKLELGAGNRRMAGWTTVDISGASDLNLDLTEQIPFPDNSVSIIYSSHMLEHFKLSELLKLLQECKRILKPGGIFSASVPNARIYIDAYYSPENFNPEVYCRYKPAYIYNSKIDYINYMAYMDGHHHYMFDEENIVIILKKTGFKNVKLRDFDKAVDLDVRNYESIYVQGEK